MVGTGTMSAAVQELGPSQAVEILAKSRAINANCQFLSKPEHQELSDYVAKAEVAAAGTIGAARANKAVHTGTSAGQSATCNNDSEITVRATMDAARRAIAASAESAQQKSQTVKARRTGAPSATSDRIAGSSARYSRLAAAYYVERRCQHLSHAQAIDFWKRIVRMHNYVLTSQGPDVLTAAKSRAIARAKSKRGCNASTAQMVRASYRKIKHN